MSEPTSSICQYYFNDLVSNNINNYKTDVYDLSLVNVGVSSSTITPSAATISTRSTYRLFQSTGSSTNYSYYVNNTNSSLRNLTGSFSVSFWIYINSALPITHGIVWSLYSDASNNFITYSQQLDGQLILCITLNGQKFYIGAAAYSKNVYHHLVLTCNTSGNTSAIQLYLNGTQYPFNTANHSGSTANIVYNGTYTVTVTGSLFNGSTSLYVLGGPAGKGVAWPAANATTSPGFNGYLSQLTIYNTTLTQTEITYLRNNVKVLTSVLGTPPTITSITRGLSGLSVYFTPGTGGYPSVSTYSYSLNEGAYVNANTTTSPIIIGGINEYAEYRVRLIGTNQAGNTGASNMYAVYSYPCFLQGTRILRWNPDNCSEEYIRVEALKRGDLIKTSRTGYKSISIIGHARLLNPSSDANTKNRLYRFPEFEDLCITGDHCTLLYDVDDAKLEQIKDYMGKIYVTEGNYRVPACLDDRAKPYTKSGPATIWHFALEHDDPYANYGIYANGLLVESSSLRYMSKLSNMNLMA